MAPRRYQGVGLLGPLPREPDPGRQLGQMGRGLASLTRKEYTVGASS